VSDDSLVKQTLQLLAKGTEAIDSEFEDTISEDEMEILQNITPEQQRYAQLVVMSNMTDSDIAINLDVSRAKIKKWKTDPRVVSYIKKLQIDQHKATRSASIQQMNTVKDRLFADIMGRFEKFDPSSYPSDTPDWLLRKYAERTAELTSFRDVIKAYEVIDKQMDNKDLIQTTRDDFVEKVIHLHQERKVQRRKMDLAMEQLGYKSYLDMVEAADGSFHAPEDSKGGSPVDIPVKLEEGVSELSIFSGEKDE